METIFLKKGEDRRLRVGHLWVFSNRKLELQGKAIEEKLQLFYGADSPVQPGSYEALFSSNTMLPRFPEPPPAEELKLGNNRWQGKWWYLLAGAGLVMLWRMVRLFAERRNIMYSYWNALEHGYCAMGIFLLAMGLVIIHSGLFNFFTALMTLFFAAAFLKYHAWGFGGMLVALLGLLVLMQCSEWWSLLIACVIMLQTMLSGGGAGKMYSRSIAEERILNEAVFLGYFLAALSLAVVWYWQLPLLLIWGLLLTAVVGGILQNKRKRVYYNRGG